MNTLRNARVTVIIPVYNSMPYLSDTLRSVLTQDLVDLEVIAVNDGSTDGSGAELDRFAEQDPRVTVVHQENSGWPGMPRNRGIERATGDFLFFMDADDALSPSALQEMVELAEGDAFAEPAEIVIPRLEGTGGRSVQTLFDIHPSGRISIARAMETLSPQKLFLRDFVERNALRFPEESVRLEDGIFVSQAYTLANRILFTGRAPLYFIALREDGKNISSQGIDPENYVASCRRIAEIVLDGVPDKSTAHRLVLQFFQRKGLRFYSPRRWQRMQPTTRAAWFALHREFLRDLVPETDDSSVAHPTDRIKISLIRSGDFRGMEALINSEQFLAHRAGVTSALDTDCGVRLLIAVQPASFPTLLHDRIPSVARFRAVHCVDQVLGVFGESRLARGINRRAAAALCGKAPSLSLLLRGRRGSRTIPLSGRMTGYEKETGTLTYSFVLSPELLRTFHSDRIDMWTVAGVSDGYSGAHTRLQASSEASGVEPTERFYVTRQGNASLRLRRSHHSLAPHEPVPAR